MLIIFFLIIHFLIYNFFNIIRIGNGCGMFILKTVWMTFCQTVWKAQLLVFINNLIKLITEN